MSSLPRVIGVVGTPPIKCQGIKTKLVPFLFSSIRWNCGEYDRWIEPFLGSGVVAFNLAPRRAILADTNEHIIRLYRAIYDKDITPANVREHLEHHGSLLESGGAEYYYEVRQRFNETGASLDFLFLNRSCFNGVMRFNGKGKFNVPFCHKPSRFARAYITKIVNQVRWMASQMAGKDWEFRHQPWNRTVEQSMPGDFLYLDPPYIGRHADYFNSWNEQDAEGLAEQTQNAPCGYAVSMWLENKYRLNPHVEECWKNTEMRVCRHFYHVGSTEDLRNEMNEALLIRHSFAEPDRGIQVMTTARERTITQSPLFEFSN